MKTAITGAVLLALAFGGHARGGEAAPSQAVVPDGSHTVLTVAHFAQIQKFILDQGKRRTYCNMFNHNPCWQFRDFNAYLNPPDQGNINCEIGKSAFDILVIQVTKPGPSYSSTGTLPWTGRRMGFVSNSTTLAQSQRL